jgi:hypothetical protein
VKKDLTEFVARLKLMLIAMVLIVGSYMVALYILTPNPYPRTTENRRIWRDCAWRRGGCT